VRDPDDHLRSLRDLGGGVEPSPAADVRRRGDLRRRHRRQALALGAAGVAPAVVVPVAWLGTPDPAPGPDLSGSGVTSPAVPQPSPPSSAPTPDSGPGGAADLAAFPLDLRLSTTRRDGVAGRAGLEGAEVCDRIPVWLENAEARRGLSAAGPEHTEDREIRVFSDADVAVSALAGLRAAVAQCASAEATYPQPSVVDLTTDLGYDSVTWAVNQEGALGPEVYAFNRVGRSIVGVHDYAGYPTPAAARDGLQSLLRDLAPSQCAWTRAGC
jgi:hypothetical protein